MFVDMRARPRVPKERNRFGLDGAERKSEYGKFSEKERDMLLYLSTASRSAWYKYVIPNSEEFKASDVASFKFRTARFAASFISDVLDIVCVLGVPC